MKGATIGNMRSRVTILQYTQSQDSAGGNIKTLANVFSMWANVRQTGGNKSLDNLQISYSKTFEIKTRYEPAMLIKDSDEILLNTGKLLIQRVSVEDEGRACWLVINAYTTNVP